MACPSCDHRKGRRECPALRQTICSVCCGTKRLAEIACPSECGYLASSREHPAAVVRRRQESDVAAILPSIRHLTERQYQLFFLFQTLIARHVPDGFSRLVDEDVADAASAFAATLETAGRGVIYEHPPQSLVAQRLVTEMKTMLAQMKEQGATVYDREVAIVLRAIEQGAREVRKTATAGEGGYLEILSRLLQVNKGAAGAQDAPGPASSLIIPGN